jgi:hypothetical protein
MPAEALMILIPNHFVPDAPRFVGFVREPEIRIAKEAPADIFAREALLDAAFGPARFQKTSSGSAKAACRRRGWLSL